MTLFFAQVSYGLQPAQHLAGRYLNSRFSVNKAAHSWALAAGGRGAVPPSSGFSNMVFFGLYCYFLVFFAIFSLILLFFGLFFVAPLPIPEKRLK